MTKQKINNIIEQVQAYVFPWVFRCSIGIIMFYLNSLVQKVEELDKKIEQIVIVNEKVIFNTEKIEKLDKRLGKVEDKVYNTKSQEND